MGVNRGAKTCKENHDLSLLQASTRRNRTARFSVWTRIRCTVAYGPLHCFHYGLLIIENQEPRADAPSNSIFWVSCYNSPPSTFAQHLRIANRNSQNVQIAYWNLSPPIDASQPGLPH